MNRSGQICPNLGPTLQSLVKSQSSDRYVMARMRRCCCNLLCYHNILADKNNNLEVANWHQGLRFLNEDLEPKVRRYKKRSWRRDMLTSHYTMYCNNCSKESSNTGSIRWPPNFFYHNLMSFSLKLLYVYTWKRQR